MGAPLISVEEAQAVVLKHVERGSASSVLLHQALGRVMAEDIVAPINVPSFAASAMDGFAMRAVDTHYATSEHAVELHVVQTIAAGDVPTVTVQPGEAIRIMTGAMIPPGATAVIPQEEVGIVSPERIRLWQHVGEGAHIRKPGEDVVHGQVALPLGTPMTPGSMGYLASLGIARVQVFDAPRIAIVPTGSELQHHAGPLELGKIYESNSVALAAACQELRIDPVIVPPVADDQAALRGMMRNLFAHHEVIVMTGGVSVGAYDFVKEVLEGHGVETLFWKVAQKPGKPLFFGRRGKQLVFGLPGNPAASLVCFYEYIRPAIRRWMGYADCALPTVFAKSATPYRKKPGRTHFCRAALNRQHDEWWVDIATRQESHKMREFAGANCLAVVPADVAELREGDLIEVHRLP